MQALVTLLTPFEMLMVNLFVIDRCSRRKYGLLRTAVVMGIFVLVLMAGSFFFLQRTPGFGDGNGLFIFCGMLFVVPVKMLYKVSGAQIITIACTSWIYTFLLFAFSIRLGYIIPLETSLEWEVLLYQSILYLLTLPLFYRLMKTKFIYLLNNTGKKESMALMLMAMMWFWSVFIVNLSYTYQQVLLFQLLALLTIGVAALSTYRYIYMQAHSRQTIQNLEKIAYQDELTQLRSRVVLGSDMEDLIRRNLPFTLLFFDLNDFKSINDRHGHLAGDEYLAFFAQEVKVRLGNKGGFYRVSGDEFVAILTEDVLEEFEDSIAQLPDMLPGTRIPFLGFSYGVAAFPGDATTAEELLGRADERMYEMKRSTSGQKTELAAERKKAEGV